MVGTINIKGVTLEIRQSSSGHWQNDKVLFFSDPREKRWDIYQYLYNEGFISDRRTPYVILEVI